MSIVSVDNIQPIGSGTTVTVNKSVTLESGNTNITGVCTATSFSGSGANLTSLPSQVTINGAGNNRLITSDSGTTLNCESSLTYDGTTLQAITSLSGTREQLNLKNQNASAGTSRINFFSTVSGTEFACAAIRNGVNTLNQGRLFLQTNKGSGLTNSLELDQSGNATITDGNLVIGTSGHGIDFSATGNAPILGASMDNELLDDYEEGSWVPYFIINGGTSGVTQPSSMQGKYTKIGNRVCVNAWGNGALVYSGSTGHSVNLKGLPFNANGGNMFSTFSHWLYRFATNVNDVNKHIIFRTNNGSDQIEVQKNNGTGCTYADFNGINGNWIIAAHYVSA